MKTFKEFLMAQKESTAAKRAKNAAFLGLAVPGPEASFNAGATANPGMLDYFNKNVKGKIKKQPQLKEAAVNHGIDKWLDSVDKLKKDLNSVPQDDERVDDLEDKDEDDLDNDEDLEDDDDERVDDLEDDEDDGNDEDEDNIEDDEIESKPKFRKRFNDEEIEPSPPEYGDEIEDEDDEIKDDYEDEDEKKIRTSLKMPQKPGFDEWTKMFSSWNG